MYLLEFIQGRILITAIDNRGAIPSTILLPNKVIASIDPESGSDLVGKRTQLRRIMHEDPQMNQVLKRFDKTAIHLAMVEEQLLETLDKNSDLAAGFTKSLSDEFRRNIRPLLSHWGKLRARLHKLEKAVERSLERKSEDDADLRWLSPSWKGSGNAPVIKNFKRSNQDRTDLDNQLNRYKILLDRNSNYPQLKAVLQYLKESNEGYGVKDPIQIFLEENILSELSEEQVLEFIDENQKRLMELNVETQVMKYASYFSIPEDAAKYIRDSLPARTGLSKTLSKEKVFDIDGNSKTFLTVDHWLRFLMRERYPSFNFIKEIREIDEKHDAKKRNIGSHPKPHPFGLGTWSELRVVTALSILKNEIIENDKGEKLLVRDFYREEGGGVADQKKVDLVIAVENLDKGIVEHIPVQIKSSQTGLNNFLESKAAKAVMGISTDNLSLSALRNKLKEIIINPKRAIPDALFRRYKGIVREKSPFAAAAASLMAALLG